jgi:hypothetical protein
MKALSILLLTAALPASLLMAGVARGWPSGAAHLPPARPLNSFVAPLAELQYKGIDMTCTVQPPASWRAAFARATFPTATDESLIPFAVAPDASRFFASDYAPAWSGVVAVSARGHQRTRIARFLHPDIDQVVYAGFDGRYLAWAEYHSRNSNDDWTLRTWDSQSGKLDTVARVGHQTNGQPIPGPSVAPVVDHGMLAWIQSLPGMPRRTQVHLYALAAGRDSVVATGQLAGVALVWPLLLWSDAARFGGTVPARIVVADAHTGALLPTPRALTTVSTPGMLAGSNGIVTWADTYLHSLSIWQIGSDRVQQVVSAGYGQDWVEFPSVAENLLAWTGPLAAFVGDLRSGAYIQATPLYGTALARGRGLVITYSATPNEKRLHPSMINILVDTADLPPLPECRAGSRA